MSDAEMEAISALRQRAQELGLSPDVINAQVMREAGDLSAVRGQSELGKMVADNPRITLEQLRNLSPKEARKLLTQSRKK